MDSFEQFEAENFPKITPPEGLSMPGKDRLRKRLVTEDIPMVLTPDLSITYPNKSELKRISNRTGVMRPIWPWMAVAAGVAALVWFASTPDGAIRNDKSSLKAAISEIPEATPVAIMPNDYREEVLPERPQIVSLDFPSDFQATELYRIQAAHRSEGSRPSEGATSPLTPRPAVLIAAAILPRELSLGMPQAETDLASPASEIASVAPSTAETSESNALVAFLQDQPIGEAVQFVKSLPGRWLEAKALPAKGEALAVAQLQQWEDQIQSHLPSRTELERIWSEKFDPKKKFARKRNKKDA